MTTCDLTPDDPAALRAFFEREGYAVLRAAVPRAVCEAARQAFLREALPARYSYFKRHASGRFERHVYTEHGHMKYPIMNLQDIAGRRFRQFRQCGLELLTYPALQQAIRALFGEAGRLVHTMYFDGNQNTWAHRDGDYFDSCNAGRMVGVWVAAEDIHPEAGRFYVVPRSQQLALNGDDPNGAAYKARMDAFVHSAQGAPLAPQMQQGDVILWSAMTVHGSLPTGDGRHARRSFTGHYVPDSQPVQRFLAQRAVEHYVTVNNVAIALHQDCATLTGVLRETVRADYPVIFHLLQGLRALAWRRRTVRN
jgi:phytanoyl-CoA hydroxylase